MGSWELVAYRELRTASGRERVFGACRGDTADPTACGRGVQAADAGSMQAEQQSLGV